jgi:Glyoxalase/Bleomycin resistance protein/Dioxygenase superfamily.
LEKRFGESVLDFSDPDGTRLALVGIAGAESTPGWSDGEIAAEHAIRAFHGVTLLLTEAAPTAAVLTGVFGFKEASRDASIIRYRAADADQGAVVDIHQAHGFPAGALGCGSVHHIAFRAADEATQAAMAKQLVADHHLHPTQQMDRKYFRSIYFREPGVFCLKSQPMARASMSTSRATVSGRHCSCRLTMSATALTSKWLCHPCRTPRDADGIAVRSSL